MRQHLKSSSFKLWRKRVSGRKPNMLRPAAQNVSGRAATSDGSCLSSAQNAAQDSLNKASRNHAGRKFEVSFGRMALRSALLPSGP